MVEKDPLAMLMRDVYKLYAIWPQVDGVTVVRFAKETCGIDISESDVASIRQGCGLDNSRFRTLGRTIVAWQLATELSTFGYASKGKAKLVTACVDACERIAMGKFSALLISEWVEDIYEELSPYATQPIKIRVYASERAAELRNLLKCEQLPTTLLRG